VRHVRMLGLCLVAIFAVGALTAGSALAGPQWVKCEKVGPGHNYTGPNCTKAEKAKPKGTGEYELYKAAEIEAKRVANGKSPGVPFTGHNEGSGGVLIGDDEWCYGPGGHPIQTQGWTRQRCEEEYPEAVEEGEGRPGREYAVESVRCGAESSSGEASGTSGVKNVHVTFTGCNIFSTIPCENGAPEEIKTNELKGKLGYINKSAKEVGVLLEPVVKHGAFATFECPGSELSFDVGVGNKKEGTAWTNSGCTGSCLGTLPTEETHGGYDGIISPIVPVNKTTSTYTQEYKLAGANTRGEHNTPANFENKHIDVLEVQLTNLERGLVQEWGAAGEEITNVVEPEEESEIKA
jgi:hypothetical protein